MSARNTLKVEGRALGLPSSCCQALAMMAALSLSGVAYSTDSTLDSDVRDIPVLVSTSQSGDRSLVKGYAALTRQLVSAGLTSGMGPQQLSLSEAVLQLFIHKVCPSYDFITTAVPEHRVARSAARRHLGTSLISRLDGAMGWSASSALKEIKGRYGISSLSSAANTGKEALVAMEALLRLSGCQPGGFAFNSKTPTLTDSTVFAATTSLLLAEFNGTGCGPLRAWQQELRGELPLLVAHAEAVRVVVGSSSSSPKTKTLPISTDKSDFDSDSQYRQGRMSFLLGTLGFMSLYFLATNAGTILALLDALEEEMDEEEQPLAADAAP
jgi:hypothetical protein